MNTETVAPRLIGSSALLGVKGEYEDAAKMDGAGLWTIIFRVYGPLLRPPIAALIVITFLSMWNDYLWPSVTMTESAQYVPITMRIQGFALSDFSSRF